MQESFNPKTNLIGKKIGRLLVISFSHKVKRTYYYKCLCKCGKEVVKSVKYLLNDERFPRKSCGCWHREIFNEAITKHGMVNTPTYRTWREMKSRCYNKNYPEYHRYGGRGIYVCERWKNSFENFFEDMGERPSGTSIDRIDVNGNYEPSNCRWADTETQSNNKRSNIYIEYNGVTKTLGQWCKYYNMNYNTVRHVYHLNRYTFDEIVNIYKNNGTTKRKK